MADIPYNPDTDGPIAGEEYDPNAHGAIVPAVPKSIDAYRVAGQVGTGINDALYQGVMALPNLSARLTRYLGLTSPNTPLPSESFQNFARSQGNERPPSFEPQNKTEQVGNAVGSGIGEAINFMLPFSVASRVNAIPSVVRKASEALTAQPVLQAAASGAGSGVTEATGNPYLGAATSLAIPGAAGVGQRAFGAAPALTTQEAERRALLQFGADNKLGPLTTGKIIDSKGLQVLESAASKSPIPFIGGRVAGTEAAGRDAFQRAALEKAGTYGQTGITPDVLRETESRIGKGFDAFKGETINVDPQFGADLAKARGDFSKQLQSQIPESIMSKIDELAQAPAALGGAGNPTASLDGETFQNIRSKLSKMLRGASGTDQEAIGATINALDDLAERSLPKDVVGDYKTARQQWRNYLALEKGVAANNPETAVGNMSPAGFARAAEGNPDIARLAQYGNAFVGDKAANTSRTAGHNLANKMLEMGGLYGAYEGLHHIGLSPLHAAAAVGSTALPPLIERGLNNPITRMMLLSRYRNPSQSIIPPGVYGSLAGQAAINQQTK